MWLATPTGFYSAVVDPKDDRNVMVRARVRDDLDPLVARGGELFHTPTRDYPFRVILAREQWAAFVADQAAGIDYGNFKARIDRIDHDRELVYSRVWSALIGLEHMHDRVPRPPAHPRWLDDTLELLEADEFADFEPRWESSTDQRYVPDHPAYVECGDPDCLVCNIPRRGRRRRKKGRRNRR